MVSSQTNNENGIDPADVAALSFHISDVWERVEPCKIWYDMQRRSKWESREILFIGVPWGTDLERSAKIILFLHNENKHNYREVTNVKIFVNPIYRVWDCKRNSQWYRQIWPTTVSYCTFFLPLPPVHYREVHTIITVIFCYTATAIQETSDK